jgi:type IV pilus assembly protein PilY1
VLSRTVVLGGLVLFTTFTPTTNVCGFQGDSSIYALYYETGTAYMKPVIGTTGSGASETILKTKSLGKGMPTTVGIAVGKKTKGYVQTSTGTIVEVETQPPLAVRSGAAGWREKTGGGGSVEIEEIYKHIVK